MNRKSFISTALLVLAALALGWWAGTQGSTHPPSIHRETEGPCPSGATPLYWKAPMDPTYIRDEPGQSPMGMALVPECPPLDPSARAPVAEGVVIVDPSVVQAIGVRTASVVRTDLTREVRAVGRVTYDERRVSHVHTKVQGWVESLFVDFVGQSVREGEPLLEIYSPELVATQEELLLAADYQQATGASPDADVRQGGRSLFEAARRRLALWDIRAQDVDQLLETREVQRTLTLHAPSTGVITQLGVRTGMEVAPNTNLYTLADLSRVWVIASVYEYELPWLELGQEASVELAALPGERLEGRLTYIAPFLDATTRTAEVRLELDNADARLKPQMFGNVRIAASPRPQVLAIPNEAVIRSGERSLVLVALGAGRFAPRQIETGLDGGEGRVEVVEGLEEGEAVVVSSQFLIDSESNLQEAVRKLFSERSRSKSQRIAAEDNASAATQPSVKSIQSRDAASPGKHPAHHHPPMDRGSR
jgi:Cu(I)/Ag(I) efflux system membrane fusion protein